MKKTLPFWAVATAAILLLCGKIVSPITTVAGQNRGAASQAATDLVQNGTHFLVRLDQEMNTGKEKVSKKFEVRTVEPLETSSGYVLPPGAKIVGHISRIEPAGLTGRARLWLTFDDIETRRGTLPIVAEVSSVPGEYSVRPGESKEGEIEARTSREVSIGAIYATLDRLEAKGYVKSRLGDPTPERGGRSKRFFRVSAKGVKAVNRTHRALQSMTSGLDLVRSYS